MNRLIQAYRVRKPEHMLTDDVELVAQMYNDPELKAQEQYTLEEFRDYVSKYGAFAGDSRPAMEQRPPDEPPFDARMGRGITDLTHGPVQLFDQAMDSQARISNPADSRAMQGGNTRLDQMRRENDLYERGAGEGLDIPRAMGTALVGAVPGVAVAGALPKAAAAGASRVLGGATAAAAEGGLTAGLMYSGEDEQDDDFWQRKMLDVGLGVGGGLLGFAGVKGLSKAGQAAWRAMKQPERQEVLAQLPGMVGMDVWARMGERAKEELLDGALKQIAQTGQLTPAALARKAALEAEGYKPTTAQNTRDPFQWQQERNDAKMPNIGPEDPRARLRYQLEDQNEQMIAKANNLAKDIGGAELPEYQIGERVRDVADEAIDTSQVQVRRMYDVAENTPGSNAAIPRRMGDNGGPPVETWDPLDELEMELTSVYDDFYDKIPPPLKVRVEKLLGRAGDDVKPGQRITPTVQQMVQLAKLANQRTPIDPEEALAVGRIRRAANDTLDRMALTDPAADAARQAAKKAARRFGFIRGKGRFKFRIVEDLVGNKTRVENFAKNKIWGGSANELSHLKRFLTAMPDDFDGMPKEQGAAAWQAIRGGVIRRMNRMAAGQNPDLEIPVDASYQYFNGKRWEQAWNTLGAKRDILFSEEEQRTITRLVQAAKDLTSEPPFSDPTRSNSFLGVRQLLSPSLLQNAANIKGIGPLVSIVMGLAKTGDAAIDSLVAQARAAEAAAGGVVSEQATRLRIEAANQMADFLAAQAGAPAGGALATQLPDAGSSR